MNAMTIRETAANPNQIPMPNSIPARSISISFPDCNTNDEGSHTDQSATKSISLLPQHPHGRPEDFIAN
jgi:hypothetical protein